MSERHASTPKRKRARPKRTTSGPLSDAERAKLFELETLWVWVMSARQRFQRQLDWTHEALSNVDDEARQLANATGAPEDACGAFLREGYEQSIGRVEKERDLFDRHVLKYVRGTRSGPPFALRDKIYRDPPEFDDSLAIALNLPPGLPVRVAGPARDEALACAYKHVKDFLENVNDGTLRFTAAAALCLAQSACDAPRVAIEATASQLSDTGRPDKRPRQAHAAALWIVDQFTHAGETTIRRAVSKRKVQGLRQTQSEHDAEKYGRLAAEKESRSREHPQGGGS